MTIALPIRVTRTAGGFKLTDGRGKVVAYVYGAEGGRLSAMADMLSMEEAEAAAKQIARALTDGRQG